jgi:hypothetical protein
MNLEDIVRSVDAAVIREYGTVSGLQVRLDGDELWLIHGDTSAKFRLVED